MDFFGHIFHLAYVWLVEYGVEIDFIIKQVGNNSVV